MVLLLLLSGLGLRPALAERLNDSGTERGRDLQGPISQCMSARSADEMTVTSATVH